MESFQINIIMTNTRPLTQISTTTASPKAIAHPFLDSLTAIAHPEAKKKGEFVLPGIGKFGKQKRKARMGRNPATGQTIKIAAKTVVKFRVGKAAKDAVLGVL